MLFGLVWVGDSEPDEKPGWSWQERGNGEGLNGGILMP